MNEFEFNSSGAVLKNVELKTETILPSSLPFYVVSGFIKRIKFEIPFTSLSSKAVEIAIEDVLLIVKPKKEQVWSESDEVRTINTVLSSTDVFFYSWRLFVKNGDVQQHVNGVKIHCRNDFRNL